MIGILMVWPAIIGGTASLAGGYMANRARAKEAQKNRSFQENMRNTAWQAGVADMEKAGLNPALAYNKGPAQSPAGNMAQQQDVVTPAISSAMQYKQMESDIRLIKEQTKKATAEAGMAEDAKWWSGQRREYYDRTKGVQTSVRTPGGKTTRGSQITADRLYALLDSEHGKTLAATLREQGMASITGAGGNVAREFQTNLSPAFGKIMGTVGRGASSIAGLIEGLEKIARMRDEAVRRATGMPKAAVIKLLDALKRKRK